MLLKLGVDISKLKPPIRKQLNAISDVFKAFGVEPVVTSTYEGSHSPWSIHYAHLAIDFRRPRKFAIKSQTHSLLVRKLREELGPDYDVSLESTHIHVEYDPKEGA